MDNTSSHSWIAKFAARLMQLRPQSSIGAAVSCAVRSIHHAGSIDPRRAAEIFVLTHATTGRGEPSRPARRALAPVATVRAMFGHRVSESSRATV
ncbi:MAG: hypothetical protein ABI702_15015 [Burkholderiales bacterium]